MKVYNYINHKHATRHDPEEGPWFFEPDDWDDGQPFSIGYATEELAQQAADKWAAYSAKVNDAMPGWLP